METKLKELHVFMVQKDSKWLLESLGSSNNLIYIDVKPKPTKELTVVSEIDPTTLSNFVLLNTDIQSLEDYCSSAKEISGYYHFAQTGRGVIQILPSRISKYNKNCLTVGRFAASYSDYETESWSSEVFKWLQKKSYKVYRIAQSKRIVSEVAEKKTIAMPHAKETYDGNNNQYLTLVKDVFCIAR